MKTTRAASFSGEDRTAQKSLGYRGIEDKLGRLKQLMSAGKEKGYVLYDEVNDLLAEDYAGGRELDDLLSDSTAPG